MPEPKQEWNVRSIDWGKIGKAKENLSYTLDTPLKEWCDNRPERLILGGDKDELEIKFQCQAP